MEPYIWIPLILAIVYALASLCMKRSSNAGIGPWRTTVIWNGMLAALALPFWFLSDTPATWTTVLPILAVSFLFFLGQLFNCLAIHKGDVSVVTPIMGTKVVFVAILAAILLAENGTWILWLGVLLSALAIQLMRGSTHVDKHRLLPSILLGLASAGCFAGLDIFMQEFGQVHGFEVIVSSLFVGCFLWSLLLIPKFKSSIHKVTIRSWGWLLTGGLLHAAQALCLGYVLATYGKATEVNIVYSSRGLWSIVFVWMIGHWFSNYERHQGKAVFVRRWLGACLLGTALILAALN